MIHRASARVTIGTLAVGSVVALGGCGSTPSTPAASPPITTTIATTTTATASSSSPAPITTVPSVAPVGDKRGGYLAALKSAGVPTSTTGDSEVLIAQGVRNELGKGTSRAKLVGDLARMGGVMNDAYAEAMVSAAEQTYC